MCVGICCYYIYKCNTMIDTKDIYDLYNDDLNYQKTRMIRKIFK